MDPGDSLWLAGYTRLVSGVLDLVLIYDLKPLYLALGKESFPTATDIPADGRNDALGTLEHLKASEPTNGERARQSFLRVSDLSFQTWQSISAETDNDREWLPNPKQTSALGLRVSEERIQDWLGFMKDWNDLLEDRKRLGVGEGSRALSLKKWFQNPPDIQDALSLQEKYWEETTKDRILDGNRTFERYLAGDNLYYALWFN